MNKQNLRSFFYLLLITCSLSFNSVRSQNLNYLQFDPVISATGLTASNPAAYSYNPALLSYLKVPTLTLNAALSRFGLSELSPGYILFGMPVSDNFVTAITGFGIGNDLYNEFSGALHGAYSISEFMDIGVSVEYFRISIKDHQLDDSYQFHIGSNVRISDFMSAGVCVKNINNSYYLGGERTSGQQGAIGFGFLIADDLTFDLGMQVSTYGQSGLSLATLYTLENIINVRFSALTSPRIVSGSVSILAIPYIDLNILSSYHDIIGWSHSFGLSVYFGTKND
jgi:hypothetical protein